METRVDEIAEDIYRLSTAVTDIPGGFTFNQFLLKADEPLLFHTGPRGMFPLVRSAVERVLPLSELRWLSFGHFEADECGSMNDWLHEVPDLTVAAHDLACMISVGDQAVRPPHPLEGGAVLDIGGRRLQLVPTPHVPHGWESALLFELETRTLLAGDLFTQGGDPPPVTEQDLVESSVAQEAMFSYTSPTPLYGSTLRQLAELEPATIACMHGSSYRGDGAAALRALADAYEERFVPASGSGPGSG